MATLSLAPAESFRQKMQQALMSGAFDTSPIQSPWQGASRLAQALMLGLEARDDERQNKEASAYTAKFLGDALGGGPAAAPAAGSPSAASPALTQALMPAGGNPVASAAPMGDQSLPRGLRNNNPLNIEAGGFTQSIPGYAGSDGRFARFESPDQGIAAADKLLQVYSTKHGLNTVAGIVGRWAPASDGNNVSAYVMNVAKQLGVDPNQPLDMANPQVRQGLIMAMGQHENGRPIQMAQNGPQQAALSPAMPPQSGPPQQMAQAPAAPPQGGMPNPLSNIPPQQRQMLLQGLQSSNPRIRAQAAALAQQYIKPPEYKKLNDDTLYDERTGRTLPVGPGYHPLVDPAERAKFGIPAEDKRPYQVGPGNKLINPPAENRISMNTVANPIISGIGEQFTKAREAANAASKSVPLIHEARKMLDEGAITGAAAPFRVQMQKVGALLGMSAEEASNAEVFRATIGNQVLANIKSLGANPSNADRDYIEKVAGGQIQLEEKSLRRILDINEKYARKSIDDFNRDSKKLMDANPDAYRGVAPLMQIEVPAEYKPAMKRPAPADIENELRRRGLLK